LVVPSKVLIGVTIPSASDSGVVIASMLTCCGDT
jgi:hypothetical protein